MSAGIVGNHVAKTNGTKGSDKAAKKAVALWDALQERMSTIVDELGDGNGFKTLAAVQKLGGLVDLLEAGGLPDISSTEIVPARDIDLQVASSSSSDAEMLGNSLLRVFGGDSNRAGLGIKFVSSVLASGEDTLDYFQSVLFALDRDTNPDEIVVEGGRYTLRSYQSLRDRKNELESALYDLIKEVYNGRPFPATLSPADLVDEAKKVLARKAVPAPVATPPAPVNQDKKLLETLERVSGIKANLPGTTFEQHLQVVLDSYSKTGRDFATELERVSGITFNNTDSIRVCVEKAANKLRASAPAPATPAPTSSGELDTIGRKLGVNRNSEIDSAYGARLATTIDGKLAKINTLEGDARKAETDRKKDEDRANAIFNANSGVLAIPADTTPVGIVEAVIKHAISRTPAAARSIGMKKITLP